MHKIAAIFHWLFEPPATLSAMGSIVWWEARRIPVNLLIAAYGLLCLAIFFAAIGASHTLPPGEDAVEPAALFLAPIAFNICYTLGWLVEIPARLVVPDLSPGFGPGLLFAGLVFSAVVISLPAVLWVVYLGAHLIGAV
jgi:hypothetical protein